MKAAVEKRERNPQLNPDLLSSLLDSYFHCLFVVLRVVINFEIDFRLTIWILDVCCSMFGVLLLFFDFISKFDLQQSALPMFDARCMIIEVRGHGAVRQHNSGFARSRLAGSKLS